MNFVLKHSKGEDRRFKIAYLHPAALLNTLTLSRTAPGDCLVRLSLDVPEGTEVIERFYDFSRQAEGVILYNPEWPVVPPGEQAESLLPETTAVKVEARLPRFDTGQPIKDERDDLIAHLQDENARLRRQLTAGDRGGY